MSIPPVLREAEASPIAWQRRVRDAVNALLTRQMSVGPTADRPKSPAVGTQHYDTTLGRPVWWHASGVWKDAAGASA